MGTRSTITVKGKEHFHSIYCHWDGYISHNGEILFNHYNTFDDAMQLVSNGDISSLGPRCDKPKGHSFDNPVDGCTVYYGRDRGESGTGVKHYNKYQDVPFEEYDYIFDGQWWVNGYETNGYETNGYEILETVINREDSEKCAQDFNHDT
jgi:hypothetical protein